MATWRRSNHSWSAVRLVRLKIARNITQHLLNECLVSQVQFLSFISQFLKRIFASTILTLLILEQINS